MDTNLFIGDLFQEVGKLTKVNSYHYKFEDYKFKTIEGMKFIVGEGKPKNLLFENTEFDGPDLLLSLVSLVKNPLPLLKSFDPKNLEQAINDNDILKWVKKHGIPYKDKELNLKYNDQLARLNILHVLWFKRKVAWLYSCFLLWKSLINEDEGDVKKYLFSVEAYYNLAKMNFKNYDEKAIIKKALAWKISNSMNIKIETEYNLEKEAFVLIFRTDSLIDIAYYQLAALMTKSPSECKGKMKKCESCSSLFWAYHGRQKYCPNCDRRTVFSRRKKMEK